MKTTSLSSSHVQRVKRLGVVDKQNNEVANHQGVGNMAVNCRLAKPKLKDTPWDSLFFFLCPFNLHTLCKILSQLSAIWMIQVIMLNLIKQLTGGILTTLLLVFPFHIFEMCNFSIFLSYCNTKETVATIVLDTHSQNSMDL